MRCCESMLFLGSFLLLFAACQESDFPQTWDEDSDGYGSQDDCAPDDPTIYPGANETCDDGIDSDCAGDLESTEVDNDGDGFTECAGDCDDGDDNRFPENPEACDGKDNDCDGETPVSEADEDGDGFLVCEGDCDDGDAEITPEDNDGDGYSPCDDPPDCDDGDPLLTPVDSDHDGFSTCDGDCDDGDFYVNPDADEVCDLVDNDCDGIQAPDEVDEDGDGDAACSDCDDDDAAMHSLDLDGDLYSPCDGDCDDTATSFNPMASDNVGDGLDQNCDGVDGIDMDGDGWASDSSGGEDCDDGDPTVHPQAADICDGIADNDCDGSTDPLEADNDFDGFSECDGDCDDTHADVFPGAADQCDDVLDNNCDGWTDPLEEDGDLDGASDCEGDCDDTDAALNLDDIDGDGWDTCNLDCDDLASTVHPGAAEGCDRLDTDCDGSIGEDEHDDDADGYAACEGDCDDTDPVMTPVDADGDGQAPCDGDCDDYEPLAFLGSTETCDDGIDNDCDPLTDEYGDLDGDGVALCDGDCDDLNASRVPGAYELCDEVDNDCDGVVPADEVDDDGDGFRVCELDCDDSDVTVHPGAQEICDGLDNDCDGVVGDDLDGDGDGYSYCEGDCDDAVSSTFPGAPELCDGVDNDCDGQVDEDVTDDLDGDGVSACDGDCNDGDPDTYPGAPETCDGLDNNCDGGLPADEADDDLDGWWPCSGDCDDSSGLFHPYNWEWADGEDNDCDGAVDEATDLLDADAFLAGWELSQRAGAPVAIVGDTDGDGFDDILVGAVGYNAATMEGAAFLVRGPVQPEVSLEEADATLIGESFYGMAGCSVTGGFDSNQDSYADLAIGACYHWGGGFESGAVYVVLGPVEGTMTLDLADHSFLGEAAGDVAGTAIAWAGDVNGDGDDDLLIGAPGQDEGADDAGAVYLILGPPSGVDVVLSGADAKLTGEQEDDEAGFSTAGAGDVNGDGLDDILVGAPWNDDACSGCGAAYLVLGPTTGTNGLSTAHAKITGTSENEELGYSMSAAGDVNGDGLGDIIVGAPDAGAGDEGAAYLFLGPISGALDGSLADAILEGEEPGASAGFAVSGAGDIDQDGYDDIVIGAWQHAGGGTAAGAAHLLLGPLEGNVPLSSADVTFHGIAGDYAGAAVAGGGDIDADGYDDLVIGAPFSNAELVFDTGSAYVLFGRAAP